MYLIQSGDKVIYDSRDKNMYPVIKPSYNEGLNEAGTLTFTLLPGHPYYDDMKKMQTFVTAYRDDTEFFYGRVLITDKELDGRMEVTCEGGLTFLLDSEMEKADHHENIETFFRRCIDAHNSQVEAAKRFSVGTISAAKALDTTKEYDFNITSYTDVKSVIETMITGRFGGYVRVRSDGNGGHCIDYLEEYGRANTQPVSIGHNIVDKSDHISGENIFTILRPVGRSQPTGQAGENTDVTIESLTQDDVTLENVVKDGKLLRLTDKIELYGNILRTEQFNSAETPIDLLKKAEEYIQRRGTQLPAVCEINFVDFYHLNNQIMDIRLGDTFSAIEGFSGQIMTVGEISLDLENPGNDTFKLKNPEEINANRLDYNVESGGKGSSSSSGLASSTASKNGQDNFRYKYYHEQDEFAKIATKQVEIAAEEHFSAIANKMYLTVMEKEGEPGEFELKAVSDVDDPNGATLIMNVDGFTLRKKAGYDKDGETILGNYATTSELNIEKDRITAEVTRASEAEGTLGSRITETAEEIKAEVYAANSTVYSYIQQTASSITAKVEDTEAGLYSYVQQTASGFRQTIAATTNRTWVQDSDPRSQAGGEHTPKVGDIWIESTHQGSWDGAEGYDWEHDEGYDWSQIMGARIWTWQNDKWELASDKQQVISYTDLVNTAENLISQKIAGIVNDEGLLDVYLSKLEQTATAIRSEVYTATSETYSYIQQTTSSIVLSIDTHIQKTYTRDFVKNGQPEIIIGEDGIARDADGRELRDGDVWINTADQDSWDKALNWTWNDDTNYNWSDLRDAEILRYDAATKSLVQVVNGRVFTDPLEMEIADDRIKANMRSIDVVNGKVEENAHQLSVTTTELRSNFNDRISNVNSDLQQTKNQLSSVYAETIRTSEWQNWYEGTGIFQNRERINAVAGKFKVDSNGNVHVIDGSGLYLGENAASLAVYTSGNLTAGAIVEKVNGGNAKILANKLNVNTTDVAAWGAYTNNTLTGGILVEKLNDNSTTTKILGTRVNVRATDLATWGVYTDDTLTAGIIVDKVNGGNVTINASKINLSGYVTASQLETTNASISNLTSGKTQASKLWASYIDVNDLHVSDGGRGSMYYMGKKVVSVNVLSKDGTKYYPVLATNLDGTASGYSAVGDAVMSFGTATSSGGKITIPTTKLDGTAGPSINFNIADTKYYKDQVSAIKTAVSSALGSAAWNTSSNVSTSIYASLDTSNKVVKINSATAKVTYPGDSSPTSVSIGLGNLDVSSALNSYATSQKNAVTLSSAGWVDGKNVVKTNAPTPKEYTVNLPAFDTSGGTSFSNHKTTVNFSTQSVQTPLKSVEVDATGEYNSGYDAGYAAGGGGASYTPVTYARGGLNTLYGYRTLYAIGDDGQYHSVGAHYWYWANNSVDLTTLYKQN